MFAGQPLEDIAEEQPEEEEEDADIGEEDEMADFIVDEEEVDEHGAPVRYTVYHILLFFCLNGFFLLPMLLLLIAKFAAEGRN